MADARQFYYRQKVTEDELNGAFAALEQADRYIVKDLGFVGIATGMVVTQHAGTPNLTVDVSAGVAYDFEGRRIEFPNAITANLAADSNNASTAVAVNGNARVVSLSVVFDRQLSDPRTDGNGDTIYFVNDEFYQVQVTMGVEATLGTEVAPSIDPDAILLADVKLVYNQTQILNAGINPYTPSRRVDFTFTTPTDAVAVNALIAAALLAAPVLSGAVLGGATNFTGTSMSWTGNARGTPKSDEASVQTTDATATTIFSWSILDEAVTHVVVRYSAVKADGTLTGTWANRIRIKRDGGTVTLGSVVPIYGDYESGLSACVVTIDNSGSTARVRVQGVAATTISWFVVVDRIEHSHA